MHNCIWQLKIAQYINYQIDYYYYGNVVVAVDNNVISYSTIYKHAKDICQYHYYCY